MTDQLDLFSTGQVRAHIDPAAAEAARDAAVRRVAAGQGDLLEALEIVVLHVADSYRDFTTDDVWVALGDTAQTVAEPRVLGAVIRQLAVRDQIRPTGLYRNSRRPACHSRPVKVWRATRERD
jgi:hypothetical protein